MLPFENCPDLLFYPFPADPQANMYRVRPYKPADKVNRLYTVPTKLFLNNLVKNEPVLWNSEEFCLSICDCLVIVVHVQ